MKIESIETSEKFCGFQSDHNISSIHSESKDKKLRDRFEKRKSNVNDFLEWKHKLFSLVISKGKKKIEDA